MMEHIIKFLNEVFSLEKETIEKKFDTDINEFNVKFDRLIKYSNDPSISFEMARLSAPYSKILEDFPEVLNFKVPERIPRHIFKISNYKYPKYQEIFACYVSERKPPPNYYAYGKCYWIGWVGDKLKFITQYSFGDPDLLKSKWMFTGGDKEITFKSLGKPVGIVRLLPPKDDPDSMEDYMNDN